MAKANKNSWVEIQSTLLQPEERSENLPADTKKVPLISYVQGFLMNETAQIGDEVVVRTQADREVAGTLIDLSPKFTHNFGQPIPELLTIGAELKKIMAEEV